MSLRRTLTLDVADPPGNLRYSEFDDFRNREILRANQVPLSSDALLTALKEGPNVIQAAAAHTLGSNLDRTAVPILQELVRSSDDLVKVEVSYALTRLGISEGRGGLIECLSYPVDAYISPAVAAGFLARLGDPQGFTTIVKCLDLNNPAVRLVACKQLYFFLEFQTASARPGAPVDVFSQFDRALRDTDTDIQWMALVQLREIKAPPVEDILEDYVQRTTDEQLADVARRILEKLVGTVRRGGSCQ